MTLRRHLGVTRSGAHFSSGVAYSISPQAAGLVDTKLRPFGLRNIKEVSVAEAKRHAGVLLHDVLLGFLVPLAFDTDDWSSIRVLHRKKCHS